MYRLYDFLRSGNGYKVRLALTQLGLPFERVEVDLLKGQTRTPAFLAMNGNGRIPLLEVVDGQYLAESSAILFYLAESTPLFPEDRFERAQVLQWMAFEQYNHEPNIATSRYWVSILGKSSEYEDALVQKRRLGYAALAVMEQHLQSRTFFVADRYGIADIALYAYTHVADEGGFSLGDFPAIKSWLRRVKDQPRHILITDDRRS